MNLKEGKILKGIVGFVGAVLVGGLGGGAWEHLLEPCIIWCRDCILFMTTLGMEKYKDHVYMEVARGLHENLSLQVYLMLSTIFVGAYATLPLITWKISKSVKSLCDSGDDAELNSDSIESRLKVLLSKAIKLRYVSLFASVVAISFLTVTLAKDFYINGAVAHFNQRLAAVRPYISEQEEIVYKSRFAQIRNQNDYEKVTTQLTEVAVRQKIIIPHFAIW